MVTIIKKEQIDKATLESAFQGDLYLVHAEVGDVSGQAKKMIETITERSWINKLNFAGQIAYSARAEATMKKLVNDIFSKIENKVTKEFGEYLISISTQDALEISFGHTKLPLAELFKERASGNSGFDFHTESHTVLIAFGEAKYKAKAAPYSDALRQIGKFIKKKKDDMELADLTKFASREATKNAANGKRAYVAAFSLNSKKNDEVFARILKSERLFSLSECSELYLVGVEVK